MTMSGDEIHLSGQNWIFNAGPALSLYRESSVGAFDRSTGTNRFGLHHACGGVLGQPA
jgi:hypothetical protein